MDPCEMETILVVCGDPEISADIVGRLHDAGASVVGPVQTASQALVLAAQTAPRSAILAGDPAGRRDAQALARELAATWGVECFMLSPGTEGATEPGDPGRARALGQMLGLAALRRVPAGLGGA